MYLAYWLLMKTRPTVHPKLMKHPTMRTGLRPHLLSAWRPIPQNRTPKKNIDPKRVVSIDSAQYRFISDIQFVKLVGSCFTSTVDKRSLPSQYSYTLCLLESRQSTVSPSTNHDSCGMSVR